MSGSGMMTVVYIWGACSRARNIIFDVQSQGGKCCPNLGYLEKNKYLSQYHLSLLLPKGKARANVKGEGECGGQRRRVVKVVGEGEGEGDGRRRRVRQGRTGRAEA